MPGLSARVTPKGRIAWSIRYRIAGDGGRQYRGTVGRWPAISLKTARAKAAEYFRLAETGVNPFVPPDLDVSTVEEMVDRFLSGHALSNMRDSTRDQCSYQIRAHILPRWGDRLIKKISRRDVARLLEEIKTKDPETGLGGPHAANDCRKWLHLMFEKLVEVDVLSSNPAHGIKQPAKLISRDRVLSMQEIQALWEASGSLGYPFGSVFRLLMLTGARRSEWAKAQRPWFNQAQQLLEIPSQHFKSQKPHVIVLVDEAVQIINGLPVWNSTDLCFSTNGNAPVSGFSRAKSRLHDEATKVLGHEIPNWRIHDFRRTVRTNLSRLGVDGVTASMILGHSLRGVDAIYDRYDRLRERREALELWTQELLS